MMSGHVRPKKATLKSFMYLKTIRHHPVQFPSKVKVAGEMGSARPLAPLLRSQRPRMRVCLNVSKCCQRSVWAEVWYKKWRLSSKRIGQAPGVLPFYCLGLPDIAAFWQHGIFCRGQIRFGSCIQAMRCIVPCDGQPHRLVPFKAVPKSSWTSSNSALVLGLSIGTCHGVVKRFCPILWQSRRTRCHCRHAQVDAGPEQLAEAGRNCPSCHRPRRVCLCDALPNELVETRTQIVLFTHPKELKRSLCTGPLLELSLKKMIKFVGKEFPDPEDDPKLHEQLNQGGRRCFLMYPGPHASEVAEISSVSPITLILIDARWQQARIMLNRSEWLQALPRVTLPHQQSGYIWRQQPAPGCISTLEAVSEALSHLEDEGAQIKSSLLRPFERMVELQCQFTPNAKDKNADLGLSTGVAKETANPLWNRSRRRKRRRRNWGLGWYDNGKRPLHILPSLSSFPRNRWPGWAKALLVRRVTGQSLDAFKNAVFPICSMLGETWLWRRLKRSCEPWTKKDPNTSKQRTTSHRFVFPSK